MIHYVLFSAVVALATLWAAPSPWTNWQIYSPSDRDRVCDTVKVRIDTSGMGAAGITSFKVLSTKYHNVIYPVGGFIYNPGIANEDTIIFVANQSDVLILRVYDTNGDSAESVLAFTKVTPTNLYIQAPQYACPGSPVSVSIGISGGSVDSFWVVDVNDPNTPLVKNEYSPTLTAPSSPGTWQLEIKAFTGSCTSSSYPISITVNDPSNWSPLPFTINVLGPTGPYCVNDSIYFELDFYGNYLIDSVKWELNNPSSPSYDDGKGMRVGYKYTSAYSGPFKAQVYVKGCSSPVEVTSSLNINVSSSISPPTLTQNDVIFQNGDYCVGNPTQVTLNISPSPYYYYEWDWDSDGTPDEVTTNTYISHTFSSNPVSFQVRVKDLRSCVSPNPSNWVQVTDTFSTTDPKPVFSANLHNNSVPECSNARLFISPTSNFSLSNGEVWVDFLGNSSYQRIYTLDTTFKVSLPPGNHSISVVLKNNCAKEDTVTLSYTIVPATANYFPFPSVSPSVICPGGIVNFSYNVYYAVVVDSIKWDFGDGTEGVSLENQVLEHSYPTSPAETTYVVRARMYYCNGNIDRYYPISVQASAPPPQALPFISSNTYCQNQTIYLSDQSQNAESVAVWLDGSIRIPLAGNVAQFSIPTPGNHTVRVIAYPRSCAPAGTQPDTVTIPLMITQGIAAQFTGPSAACVNQTVSFTHSSPGGTNYIWNFGDGNTSSSTNPTVSHVYTAPGTYYVNFSVSTPSCGYTSTSSTITIYQGSPTASITSANLSGLTLSYAGTATNYASIEWDFGDGNTSTSLSGTHTYANPGSYTVKLRAFNPCDTVEVTQNLNVTTLASTNLLGIRLYPNPSQGTFTVEVPQNWQNATVRIFDLQGKLLHQSVLDGPSTQLSLRLSQGLYQLQVNSTQGSETLRLVIQN